MTIILAAVAWLLTYLLHSTVLLVGAFALAGLGIVRSHAGRDTLWKVALVGGILTATAQTALRLQPPAGHVALAARPESPLIDVAGVRSVTPLLPTPAADQQSAASTFAQDVADTASLSSMEPIRSTRPFVSGLHISWPAILLNMWFIGALGFGARLVWMRRSLASGLKERRDLGDGPLADTLAELSRAAGVDSPRLSVSTELHGPIAFGREICVPERVLSRLSASEQRAVLAHELGHVVRRDPAWVMAAAVIESVLFVQPLNRLARRRLRAESEYLCDDWAAERTGGGVVLARCLAEVAGWVQGHAAPAPVAGMAGQCSELVTRVERLLDGSKRTRPMRWVLRAGAGLGAMILVACSVPGVAAEDLDAVSTAIVKDHDTGSDPSDVSSLPGEGWGAIRDDGRMIVLSAGYTVRLSGSGRVGFRQWGRALLVLPGYEIRVSGDVVNEDQDLCDKTGQIRIAEIGGTFGWDVEPIRRAGAPAFAYQHDYDAGRLGAEVRRALADAQAEIRSSISGDLSADIRAEIDEVAGAEIDAALNGEADAAIDTLVQLWVRDPDAVRRAARRIARTYDRDLRPQFESLGVQVGRELAPQLERLTSRMGRDLGPEFARLGAALGASILSDLSASPEEGAGSGDYSRKKPKH